ncbi:O-acetylserine synthase [Oryzomicrobium terrae]|uniref:O-acetylserine synthase n=1 Tax=Oryzomicrobium terrae TaxID=1735038 RepID=A0A5C1E9R0_9RHOO|nr:DapH/DapD/GlmU-related protein [Oryzomicrobium terrae]QEL65384.1 O-acetylserine synthase [Oryzomicrobium terrae]
MMIRLYRLSHLLWRWRVPFLPWAIKVVNRIVFGVVLPPSCHLGRQVLLSYQGLGTVIHGRAWIGDGAVISTGVTIGGRSGHEVVPVIEEGAFIGSGAKVLGPVRIGRFASVGANAVVLEDVPPYGVAVGIPARVVRINRPEDLPRYDRFF